MPIRLGDGTPLLTQQETRALTEFILALNRWFARHPRLMELDPQGQQIFELSRAWGDRLLDANAVRVQTEHPDVMTPVVNQPVDS